MERLIKRRINRLTFLLLCLFLPFSVSAENCNLIYDEFDSLMNKDFLINPGKYVKVKTNKLSRIDHRRLQNKFLLKPDNQGYGIAIFHTNKNTWGKLLFKWQPGSSQPSLLIKEAVLYGRVKDGHQARTLKNISVRSSYTLDLDTGKTGAGDKADIWFHNVDGREMYIEARNGASLTFPVESLCSKKKSFAAISEKTLSAKTLASSPANPGTATSPASSGEKTVVKREILPNGHVLTSYSDGSKMERYPGGYTATSADGQASTALFSTAAPVDIPVAPPDTNEQAWLAFHSGRLLSTIENLVNDPALVKSYIEGMNNSNIYEEISQRSQIIDYLLMP